MAEPARNKIASALELHLVGDRGLLLDAVAGRVYALNPSATLIWCHLEDGMAPATIAVLLHQRHGLEPRAARSHVEAVLRHWHRAPGPPPEPRAEMPVRPEGSPAAVATRHYRLLGTDFALGYATQALASEVDPMLSHLAADPGRAPVRLTLAPRQDGFGLYHPDGLLADCGDAPHLLPMLKMVLTELVLRRSGAACALHGALLHRDGRGLLLAGIAGSGKSTLAAGLLGAGFELAGDDTTLLDGPDCTATGVPFGICLKTGSWPHLAARLPQLTRLPVHVRPDRQAVRYLPHATAPVTITIDRIVFPTWRAGAATSLAPLPPALALERLLLGCVPLAEPVAAPLLQRLIRWIEGVRPAVMTHDELAAAVAATDEFCR